MLPLPSSLLTVGAAGGGGVWTTARTATLGATSTGWQGYTKRQSITAAGLADLTGTQIRVKFQTAPLGTVALDKVYVGVRGAGTFDLAAKTQLFFGGSPSFSIFDTTITSDGASFSYSGTSDLVIMIYVNAAAGSGAFACQNTAADSSIGYKAGDDTANLTATGYTTGTVPDCIPLIEVLV